MFDDMGWGKRQDNGHLLCLGAFKAKVAKKKKKKKESNIVHFQNPDKCWAFKLNFQSSANNVSCDTLNSCD